MDTICFREERDILNRWTEYCTELYNHKTNGDPSVLNCTHTDTENDHPILRREVEAAVQSLKKGTSAGVSNIPAELVQAGGEDVIIALTTIRNNIWQTGESPTPWTQSLSITFPRKANCSSARTTKQSASPVTQAKSCWRSYWTDWSHNQRRSSLNNRQVSEQVGAPQSRSSTYALLLLLWKTYLEFFFFKFSQDTCPWMAFVWIFFCSGFLSLSLSFKGGL